MGKCQRCGTQAGFGMAHCDPCWEIVNRLEGGHPIVPKYLPSAPQLEATGKDDGGSGVYGLLSVIVGACTFLLAWAYSIDRYGWFIGLGLGWLPALIIGLLAGMLWPFAVIVFLILYLQSRR